MKVIGHYSYKVTIKLKEIEEGKGRDEERKAINEM